MTNRNLFRIHALAAVLSIGLGGCATEEWVRGYVQEQLKPVHARDDGQDGRIAGAESAAAAAASTAKSGLAAVNKRVDAVETTLKEHDARIAEASKAARDALERAVAAGKLAEGKLVYETVMSDDSLKFGSGRVTLTEEGKAFLTRFADDLRAKNQNVYVEIQGHTDSTGPEALNERLGLQRAETVRRYLAMAGGIPLHRLAAVSYGENEPVADNKTRDGRKSNRRVTLIVLR